MAESEDQTAFREIFDHYFPGLLSFAYSIVKDNHQAEEIVGDVFYKVWLNKTALPSINNFTQYLYTATKNTSLNYLSGKANAVKKNSILVEDLGNEFDSHYYSFNDTLVNRENLISINNAINLLPPKCKLIFRLVKDEGLKYAEVAQLLNISVKAVERQMTIALKKIISILENELEEYSSYFKKIEKKG
jgi:RNA polymerase sigma-70 factor (ECF subfamily)